jgi:gluconate 2-dehydrogenase gamma chain
MPFDSITRRDVLKTLGVTAASGSVLGSIHVQAATYVHDMIAAEKADAKDGAYAPKYFSAEQYKTLMALCDTIFPPDADSAGAVAAGAPEYIDLLTSENADFQRQLGGGILWLDGTCASRYGAHYLDCKPEQQREILDVIAYRKSAKDQPQLEAAVAFFALLRNLAADGFFTSKIGIQYLGYIGNTYLTEFPGCPPVPGL